MCLPHAKLSMRLSHACRKFYTQAAGGLDPDFFYNNTQCMQAYKNHLKKVVTRVNTINGKVRLRMRARTCTGFRGPHLCPARQLDAGLRNRFILPCVRPGLARKVSITEGTWQGMCCSSCWLCAAAWQAWCRLESNWRTSIGLWEGAIGGSS